MDAAQLASRLEQRGGELSVGSECRVGRRIGAHLDTDLVCPRGEVSPDALDDRADVAPRDERVDEAVAPVTGKVLIAPAQAPEIVHVAGQREVVLREGAPDPAPV